MRTFPGWSLTFDEVPPSSSARLLARTTGVDLKRVPPKSRPAACPLRVAPQQSRRPARTPPSTFLFLPIHLSNSPGPDAPPPQNPESHRSSSASDRNRTPGPRMEARISEELRGRKETPRRTAHREPPI